MPVRSPAQTALIRYFWSSETSKTWPQSETTFSTFEPSGFIFQRTGVDEPGSKPVRYRVFRSRLRKIVKIVPEVQGIERRPLPSALTSYILSGLPVSESTKKKREPSGAQRVVP